MSRGSELRRPRRGRSRVMMAALAGTVIGAVSIGAISLVSAANGPQSILVPMAPVRILDTRPPSDGPIGVPVAAPLQGDARNGADCFAPVDLQITGVQGVPANATAVILNITVTRGDKDGYLTVYPTGQPRPTASNLNWVINRTIANLATVQVGAGGKITFCNYNGNVDVIADLSGYYVPGSGSGATGPAGPALAPVVVDAAAGGATSTATCVTPKTTLVGGWFTITDQDATTRITASSSTTAFTATITAGLGSILAHATCV